MTWPPHRMVVSARVDVVSSSSSGSAEPLSSRSTVVALLAQTTLLT